MESISPPKLDIAAVIKFIFLYESWGVWKCDKKQKPQFTVNAVWRTTPFVGFSGICITWHTDISHLALAGLAGISGSSRYKNHTVCNPEPEWHQSTALWWQPICRGDPKLLAWTQISSKRSRCWSILSPCSNGSPALTTPLPKARPTAIRLAAVFSARNGNTITDIRSIGLRHLYSK